MEEHSSEEPSDRYYYQDLNLGFLNQDRVDLLQARLLQANLELSYHPCLQMSYHRYHYSHMRLKLAHLLRSASLWPL